MTKARYKGVSEIRPGYFAAQVFPGNSRTVVVGHWRTPEDAALARDRGVLHFGLERDLNFPTKAKRLGPATPKQLRDAARRKTKEGSVSKFIGVARTRGRWCAIIRPKRDTFIYISKFDTPEEAALAYDRVARHLGYPKTRLNFPNRNLKPATIEEMQKATLRKRKSKTTSRYVGVSLHADGNWTASISIDNKTRYIGLFEDEVEAAVERDKVARLAHGARARLNFPD